MTFLPLVILISLLPDCACKYAMFTMVEVPINVPTVVNSVSVKKHIPCWSSIHLLKADYGVGPKSCYAVDHRNSFAFSFQQVYFVF